MATVKVQGALDGVNASVAALQEQIAAGKAVTADAQSKRDEATARYGEVLAQSEEMKAVSAMDKAQIEELRGNVATLTKQLDDARAVATRLENRATQAESALAALKKGGKK